MAELSQRRAYDTDFASWAEEQAALLRAQRSWARARQRAADEMRLLSEAERSLPAQCPWTVDEALRQDFYPDQM